MNIKPLHDRVVVKRMEAESTSKGGIIMVDSAKEKPAKGVVIAVGKGSISENSEVIPLDVKVGDDVLFGRLSGTEVEVDSNSVLIMRESDILGVICN